jgi:glycosyltransferase involved in cell wall biosynthesis
MSIYAFIQMYNEECSGHLKRCLDNCKKWASEIIIYDDKSTDKSVELARKYTNHIILGDKNEWTKETFHKQTLLEYIHTMERTPKWILWIDCDEIVDKNCIKHIHNFCKKNETTNIDAFSFQQINLWRGEKYYRTDGPLYGENYNGAGWFVRLWRYSPTLKMDTIIGSDQRLYPITIKNIQPCDFRIIHYGFANYKKMMKHIGAHNSNKQQLLDTASGDIYVKLANSGAKWAETYVHNGKGVPNMFLNESKLTVKEIPDEWFPKENIPLIDYKKPEPFPINELIIYNKL